MSRLNALRKAYERASAEDQKLSARREMLDAESQRRAKRRDEMGYSSWREMGESLKRDEEEFEQLAREAEEALAPYMGDGDGV